MKVQDFAKTLKLTSDKLLEKFVEAGIAGKSEQDEITPAEKTVLVKHIMATKNQPSPPDSAQPSTKNDTLDDQLQKQREKRQKLAQQTKDVVVLDEQQKKPAQPTNPKPASIESPAPQVEPEITNKDLFDKSLVRRRHHRDHKKIRSYQQVDQTSSIETKHGFNKPVEPVIKEITVKEQTEIADLARQMSIKSNEIIASLFKLGVNVTINEMLDQETAAIVIEDMGHKAVLEQQEALEDVIVQQQNADTEQKPRPPIITIMGHVDHGKTSLLDYIRKTKVTASESGGITQHIGAYQVTYNKKPLTFLDTPGHEAFSQMRARGSQLTDIVILVVAADDGVMPRTIEAIQHAQTAKVPIIVAVNKIDKTDANPDKIMTDLSSHNIVSEKWGGDTLFFEISALKGTGINELLEGILLQSEMLNLEAPNTGAAKGVVVESRMDKGHGAVSSVVVQSGSLQKNDFVVCGCQYGKIRLIFDDAGTSIKQASPASPVEIVGFKGVCDAGDSFFVVESEKQAKDYASTKSSELRKKELMRQKAKSADTFLEKMQSDLENKTLNILLKADVRGSVEAIIDALHNLSTDEVKVEVVYSGVGGINETDASLANSANALIVGFNVRADSKARKMIDQEKISLKYYSVIYHLLDDVKASMSGLLEEEVRDEIVGVATVREVFRAAKIGAVAGCMVTEGTVKRNNPIRILRDNVVVFEGKLESLKRFTQDAQEVRKDTECGIGVKGYNDIKVGDQIEVFERVTIKREL